tara:strand:+ start:501 stop:698 length:198 start_codon:yes stop_codon:yes gene_type:complete
MIKTNLNYAWLKHQIKNDYNINLDDLPAYQVGIIKYLYKQAIDYKNKHLRLTTFNEYIREVIHGR